MQIARQLQLQLQKQKQEMHKAQSIQMQMQMQIAKDYILTQGVRVEDLPHPDNRFTKLSHF